MILLSASAYFADGASRDDTIGMPFPRRWAAPAHAHRIIAFSTRRRTGHGDAIYRFQRRALALISYYRQARRCYFTQQRRLTKITSAARNAHAASATPASRRRLRYYAMISRQLDAATLTASRRRRE